MAHTPAPWTINNQANTLKGAGGQFVCDINGVFGWDARLIAAAPELLDALIRLRKATLDDREDISAARSVAAAAIAKAQVSA